jgi:SAM-dependent methyltransferase
VCLALEQPAERLPEQSSSKDTLSESHLEFYRRWHRHSKPYIEWQFEQFKPHVGRRLADVGCGLGNFTNLLLDRDLYLGIDLDEELLAELRRNYDHSPIVETLVMDATSAAFVDVLHNRSIDTIICANVIEHIRDDRLAVANMIRALPVGGHLCLLVPAMPFLFGTLDELDGHFRRYTRCSLIERFDGLPADLVRAYYFNFVGVPGWFVKGRVLKQATHTDDNYKIMNALLPIVRPLERFCSPPIGMSVIGIYRRRE